MPRNVSRANAAKSEVRAHVEHVFARQKGSMALVIRSIGSEGDGEIGLANLVQHAPHGLARRHMTPTPPPCSPAPGIPTPPRTPLAKR